MIVDDFEPDLTVLSSWLTFIDVFHCMNKNKQTDYFWLMFFHDKVISVEE